MEHSETDKFNKQNAFRLSCEIVTARHSSQQGLDTKTGFFKGVLGTRFGFLQLKIWSLEPAQIIIGSLKSEKSDPYREREREFIGANIKQFHTN